MARRSVLGLAPRLRPRQPSPHKAEPKSRSSGTASCITEICPMKSSLYVNYSTRSLIRGGQRTILALFCIAVGIMAIVGLQLAAESMLAAVTGNVRALNQGDVS